MSRRWALPLALTACSGAGPAGGPDADRDTGAAEAVDPSPWEWSDDRDTPLLSAEATAAAAQAGLDAMADIDPEALYDAYEGALSQGSPDCPGTYPAVGLTTGWANDCVTGTGWGFSGRSQLAWVRDVPVDDLRMERYGEFITNARITSPDGAALDIEGYGELRAWTDDDDAQHEDIWLFGTFSHDGAWLEPGWLDAGASLSVTAARTSSPAARVAVVDGGLSRHPALPEGVAGVVVRDLTLSADGAACSVSGELVVLGAEGDRVSVALSGSGATCAACGTPDRADLGELCIDATALLPEAAP